MATRIAYLGGNKPIGTFAFVAKEISVDNTQTAESGMYIINDLDKYDFNEDGVVDIADLTILNTAILDLEESPYYSTIKTKLGHTPDIADTTNLINRILGASVKLDEETGEYVTKTNAPTLKTDSVMDLTIQNSKVTGAEVFDKHDVIKLNLDGTTTFIE